MTPTPLGWAMLIALAALAHVLAWLLPGNVLPYALVLPLVLAAATRADHTRLDQDTDQ